MHREFQWRNLRESGHLDVLSVDERITLKGIINKQDTEVWIGSE